MLNQKLLPCTSYQKDLMVIDNEGILYKKSISIRLVRQNNFINKHFEYMKKSF